MIYNNFIYMSLSRNYSFADKQERTAGRSKVVRKFLCRNFLPPEVQKRVIHAPPFLGICNANAILCVLSREMLAMRLFTDLYIVCPPILILSDTFHLILSRLE